MNLRPDDIAQYRREGFLSPLRVMPESDMAARLRALEEIERSRAGRLAPHHNIKAHLLIPWVWDLVHHPAIVAPVQALLGPDVLCWAASFFDKRPGDQRYVSWHQDSTYWGLSEPEGLTAWVALTPSLPENGCMRVSPRTHHVPLAHADTADRANMLPGREIVVAEVDEAAAVDIRLAPGEMSLHHSLLIHGSQPNTSGQRRCGLAIRYIPGHVTRRRSESGSATLVAGRDHGHFTLEQRPEAAFHPDALARYAVVQRQWMRDVFHEFAQRGTPS